MTSQEWWDSIKGDDELITEWLKKQWIGETTATARIRRLKDNYTNTHHDKLEQIAKEEELHAKWIQGLLESYNVDVSELDVSQAESRYWAEVLPGIIDFETGAAVAAHAELMRLERIMVIVNDPSTPENIREVFAKILPMEERHESLFWKMTTAKIWNEQMHSQLLGEEALGLTY